MSYQDKIRQEQEIYKDDVNVHDLPQAFHYVANKSLIRNLRDAIGVSSYAELIVSYINLLKSEKDEADIEILSLGSGNCDIEINLAYDNNLKCKFFCYEVNPHMLDRGRELAVEKFGENHNFEFVQSDINQLKLPQQFDIVIASHSLHHFVELEHIFEEVSRSMTDKSYFIVSDMIGRNGHMFWDNTLEFCNMLWDTFPKELKYNHLLQAYHQKRIQWDCSTEGFEGIRAQDILPLLDKTFKFKDFVPFYPIAGKFIDRDFGHNFDVNNELHKSLLDTVDNLDDFLMRNGLLKPTQLIATMVNKNVDVPKYRYLYLKDPKEAYLQDDDAIWEYFDRCRKPEDAANTEDITAPNDATLPSDITSSKGTAILKDTTASEDIVIPDDCKKNPHIEDDTIEKERFLSSGGRSQTMREIIKKIWMAISPNYRVGRANLERTSSVEQKTSDLEHQVKLIMANMAALSADAALKNDQQRNLTQQVGFITENVSALHNNIEQQIGYVQNNVSALREDVVNGILTTLGVGDFIKFAQPGHFYSPIVSINEVEQYKDKIFAAKAISDIPHIDYGLDGQLQLLNHFKEYMRELPFKEEKAEGQRYHHANGFFNHCDAAALYGMLRHYKPKRIIEVGSGFSSAAILDINQQFFDNRMQLSFIEPYPERLYSLLSKQDEDASTIYVCPLQEVDDSVFTDLEENDILYIDSTHVSKTGSDVNHYLFKIFPLLKPGVIIHIHDIFWPFEIPKDWVYEGRDWNETYMIRAFLEHNPAYSILFWGHFLINIANKQYCDTFHMSHKGVGGSLYIRKNKD